MKLERFLPVKQKVFVPGVVPSNPFAVMLSVLLLASFQIGDEVRKRLCFW